MFTEKQTILLVGTGLIALNALLFSLLLFWPDPVPTTEKQHAQATTTENRTQTAEVVATEAEERSNGTVSENDGIPAPQQQEITDLKVVNEKIEQPVREVDKYLVPVYTEGTVLEAMQAFEQASGTFTYSGKTFPGIGVFIEEIQGKREGGGYHWILYINGETSDLGVSVADVSLGDVVEWRYEPSIY